MPTLHPDVGPGLAQHVGGGAAVVPEVVLRHLADEQRVPVALLLHVAAAVRVQQHGVLSKEGGRERLRMVKLDTFHQGLSYNSSIQSELGIYQGIYLPLRGK